MGSPISSTLTEIYLQYLEENYIKHCIEHKYIIYYRIYVDDLLIIFDQSRIKVDKILSFINNIDDHLEFKISEEENNTLQYLYLSISTNNNSVELDIYRKPTYIDTMIDYTSNHPYDHKLAAFIFYINRMITMPITGQAITLDWQRIVVSLSILFAKQKNIHTTKITRVTQTQPPQQQSNRRVSFTFNGPSVHRITNLLRKAGLKIAFRSTNTIFQQLTHKLRTITLVGYTSLNATHAIGLMWDNPAEQ